MPLSDFGVSRDGIPIERLNVRTSVETGIAYDVQFPGLVPFFEEYEAMIRANYSEREWPQIPFWEKAKAIAHHRLKKMINLHEGDAVDLHLKLTGKK